MRFDRSEMTVSFLAGAVVLLLFLSSFIQGYQTGVLDNPDAYDGINEFAKYKDFLGLLIAILISNLPATAVLFSGFITFGVGSLVATVLLGFYLGFATGLNILIMGFDNTVMTAIWYAPLEFIGMLLAAIAGVRPAMRVLMLQNEHTAILKVYLESVYPSLKLLILSEVLIMLAAVMETCVVLAS